MSVTMDKPEKFTVSLDASVYRAISADAEANGRQVADHVRMLLGQYALDKDLLEKDAAAELRLFWDLVNRAVAVAVRMCRQGNFAQDLTARVFSEMEGNPAWMRDYERFVRDNPYKNGNPRKGLINREIGFRIREAINGITLKARNGKNATAKVTGSIIQSYTPMTSFELRTD